MIDDHLHRPYTPCSSIPLSPRVRVLLIRIPAGPLPNISGSEMPSFSWAQIKFNLYEPEKPGFVDCRHDTLIPIRLSWWKCTRCSIFARVDPIILVWSFPFHFGRHLLTWPEGAEIGLVNGAAWHMGWKKLPKYNTLARRCSLDFPASPGIQFRYYSAISHDLISWNSYFG